MTYAYGMKGSPAVGGGIPGLPRRKSVASVSARIGDIHISEHPLSGEWIEADGRRWDARLNDSPLLADWLWRSQSLSSLAGLCYDADFSPNGDYLAIACAGPPYIYNYKRNGESFSKLFDPSELPAGIANGVAFSADSGFVAVAHNNSPHLTAYRRSGDSLIRMGGHSASLGGNARRVAFAPDAPLIAVTLAVSPYIAFFSHTTSSLSKLPNPSDLPGGASEGVAFSPDGNYVAVAHANAPFITVYRRESGALVKLPDPVIPPGGNARAVAFSPDSTYLAVGNSSDLALYDISSGSLIRATGFEGVIPAVYSLAFSRDGSVLAAGLVSSPYINFFDHYKGALFKRPNLIDALPGIGHGVAFSPEGTHIAVAHAQSPYATIYGATVPKIEARMPAVARIKVA